MGTRVAMALSLALGLEFATDVHAQTSAAHPKATTEQTGEAAGDRKATADQKPDRPDAAPPLLVRPNGAAASAAEAPAPKPGFPPPRALDSARTPMPDRLALPHAIQYYPLAPPTPPIPEGTNQGGGARRMNDILRGAGGAPPDLPRDAVTRTPEDQLAPRAPPSP
ncbi:MAG TPA: hypothetical protein VHO06_11595 [Polyangia bacterium]|nr:hypothetical protein [Polyangia bacterium]